MVGDFAIRDSVTYTNDHGCKQLWLAIDVVERIINANSSHLQILSVHQGNLWFFTLADRHKKTGLSRFMGSGVN